MSQNPTFVIKVISPSQTFYEGPAQSVTATNKVGKFDVLAGHANFFSLLIAGEIVINTPTTTIKIPIQHGIIKVTNGQATLFIYLPDD